MRLQHVLDGNGGTFDSGLSDQDFEDLDFDEAFEEDEFDEDLAESGFDGTEEDIGDEGNESWVPNFALTAKHFAEINSEIGPCVSDFLATAGTVSPFHSSSLQLFSPYKGERCRLNLKEQRI
jgi:hypothetical protein